MPVESKFRSKGSSGRTFLLFPGNMRLRSNCGRARRRPEGLWRSLCVINDGVRMQHDSTCWILIVIACQLKKIQQGLIMSHDCFQMHNMPKRGSVEEKRKISFPRRRKQQEAQSEALRKEGRARARVVLDILGPERKVISALIVG
ncbi:hypothetical protein AOLI_G00099540 [Acnodon oligacanthus]